MNARTKQLFDSQSVKCVPKGETHLEITLTEKGTVKLCRSIALKNRAHRAFILSLFNEGVMAVGEGQDPEAVARVIRQELFA